MSALPFAYLPLCERHSVSLLSVFKKSLDNIRAKCHTDLSVTGTVDLFLESWQNRRNGYFVFSLLTIKYNFHKPCKISVNIREESDFCTVMASVSIFSMRLSGKLLVRDRHANISFYIPKLCVFSFKSPSPRQQVH